MVSAAANRDERLCCGYLLSGCRAGDLHGPSFNQRIAAEVIKGGFLDRHVPTIRSLYKSQRDAMLAALVREMQGVGLQWNAPDGGMFLWARLPQGMDAEHDRAPATELFEIRQHIARRSLTNCAFLGSRAWQIVPNTPPD